jgi:small-conductance mechanosensitive channel
MTAPRKHGWLIGIIAGLLAVAALVGGKDYGNIHASTLNPKLIVWISAAVLLVSGVVATRQIASALGHLITLQSIAAAGAAVRLIVTCIGYLVVIIAVFEVLGLGVTVDHLLVVGGLAGVVLGIAAQQSLGNLFAAIVLLFSRPFRVGDHIRIRSGPLGGVFDVWVLDIGLVYVTVRTEDGELKIPNSAMLAAGVGHFKSAPEDPEDKVLPEDDAGDQAPGMKDL